MSKHRSVWLATPELADHPPLHGRVDVDVVVVGGGITGLTTALLLQRNGARVAVVEADRIGAGTTGHTTGKLTSQHGLVYHELAEQHGEAKARLYAQANQDAITTVAALADDLGAACRFERAPAYLYTRSPERRAALEAEHAAARRLGLPATLTDDIDLPFPVELALRFDHQAHFHAGRYLDALARAVVAGGGKVFAHTRATKVDENGDHAIVRTSTGDVRAEHVVVATLLPFVDLGGFFAKARPMRAYGVAARLRTDAPAGMHISIDDEALSTKPWVDDDRRGLIVVGENHPTGHGEAGPARWGALERWARVHFDVESFEYRWSAQDYTTADGVPYVGRSPRTSRTFVATGYRKWGLTNATAAAVVLADLIAGREHPWLQLYDATRIGDASTVVKLIEENLHVAKTFVTDRTERFTREGGSAHELALGEGGIVEFEGRVVGAYRDLQGQLHAVDPACSHMGCTVRWNAAETSWDCPCHGSRFSADGEVLDAPAVEPLTQVDVPVETRG